MGLPRKARNDTFNPFRMGLPRKARNDTFNPFRMGLPRKARNDTSLVPFVPVFSPVFFYFKRLSRKARNDTKEDLPLINL